MKHETFTMLCPQCGMESIDVTLYIGYDKLWHGGCVQCRSCGFDISPYKVRGENKETIRNMCKKFEPPIEKECDWMADKIQQIGVVKGYIQRKTNLYSYIETNYPELVTKERVGNKIVRRYNINGTANSRFPRYIVQKKDGSFHAINSKSVFIWR